MSRRKVSDYLLSTYPSVPSGRKDVLPWDKHKTDEEIAAHIVAGHMGPDFLRVSLPFYDYLLLAQAGAVSRFAEINLHNSALASIELVCFGYSVYYRRLLENAALLRVFSLGDLVGFTYSPSEIEKGEVRAFLDDSVKSTNLTILSSPVCPMDAVSLANGFLPM